MSVIDDYLMKVKPEQRRALQHVRDVIMKVASEGTDSIGYGMPVIKYKQKYLIGFAPFKDHLSIFPGAEAIAVYKEELQPFKTSKGTVQFTLEQPIPDSLLEKLVSHRKRRIDYKSSK